MAALRMLAIGATFLTVAATGSAAVPRSDAHPVVGRGVVSELAREGQARVIVAFRVEQPTGLRRLAGIVRETSAIRDRVLKRLGSGNGFVPAARWDAVAAMPGLVTAPGLRRLSSDPEVSHIDLDTGG